MYYGSAPSFQPAAGYGYAAVPWYVETERKYYEIEASSRVGLPIT
ncbi:MAG: hypothetical protein ACO1NT_13695 [Parapedobacter sp.]